MTLLLLVTISIVITYLINYFWSKRRLFYISNNLPGPAYIPFVGNGLSFMCKNEEILHRIHQITAKYEHPMRFWLGPKLIILFSDPNHIEKILQSSKLAYKHEIYDFLKVCLGDGLVTGSGPKWKVHRKIIQPLFDLKFLSEHMDVFRANIQTCMENMEKYVDSGIFDIHKVIHPCFIDIVGQIIMGIEINSQHGQNMEFVKASIDIYDFVFTRMAKPWLHPDIIFNLTSTKHKTYKAVKILEDFVTEAIMRNRSSLDVSGNGKALSIVDHIRNITEKNPDMMNLKDFMHHLLTLYAASEDTMTIITSFVCICLGMYPEIQEKAFQEIRSVIKDSKSISLDDISKLEYLDMCIKEVLRLVPIAPFIIRQTMENFQIDKWTIPANCAVLVSIFNLHRDPKLWENPNDFYPDHFLPESIKKRHRYAFVPFSAGPRGCIGKLFSNICIKIMLVNILTKFAIEAEGKFPDIKIRMDISIRPTNGYNVKLRRR